MTSYNHYKRFLGAEIDMKPASEPTDIIWENRHIGPAKRLIRSMIASLGIFLLLTMSFMLIYYAK